jgi:hypothetical protein
LPPEPGSTGDPHLIRRTPTAKPFNDANEHVGSTSTTPPLVDYTAVRRTAGTGIIGRSR